MGLNLKKSEWRKRKQKRQETNLWRQDYLESVEKAVEFPEFSAFLERE